MNRKVRCKDRHYSDANLEIPSDSFFLHFFRELLAYFKKNTMSFPLYDLWHSLTKVIHDGFVLADIIQYIHPN